ncbi:MAG: hypothetical protein ACLP0L_15880 [Solirubrobacteraceae bacterium]
MAKSSGRAVLCTALHDGVRALSAKAVKHELNPASAELADDVAKAVTR